MTFASTEPGEESRPVGSALSRKQAWFVGLLAAAFIIVAGLAIFVFPQLAVPDAPLEGKMSTVTAASVAAERSGIRTATLAALAALGAGVGLFYTHRNYVHQVGVAAAVDEDRRAQMSLAQRTFVAERFNDAVKQLADRESESVRVAGAYSLGSVAAQDPEQKKPVEDVLTSFLLDFCARNPNRARQPHPRGPIALESLTPLALDARAAAIVLARSGAQVPVSLAFVDLTGLDLRGANLSGCDLRQAKLNRADLRGARLYGSDLTAIAAMFARFENCSMEGTVLRDATLIKSTFDGATMKDTDLFRARIDEDALTPGQLAGVIRTEPV